MGSIAPKDVTVCTACFYPDRGPIRPLLASCRRFGVHVRIFGLGQAHVSYVGTKLLGLLDFLEAVSTPYLLYVDGTDVLWAGGLDEILDRYEGVVMRQGARDYMIGSELTLWPLPELRHSFLARAERLGTGSPFVYHAPGLIMGSTAAIRRDLAAMKDAIPRRQREPIPKPWLTDDMLHWELAIHEGLADPAIDYNCDVTIPLKNGAGGLCRYSNGRLVCDWTGTKPPILHFNGLREAAVQKRMLMAMTELGYGKLHREYRDAWSAG